jgi:DNA-directed RNA polymerase specialized sigma24 family protein
MKVVSRALDELRYYLRAWRSWVRAWRAPLGLPSSVAWLGVMPPTPAWDVDDADQNVDSFILRAIDAEIESLSPKKRAALRQYYLNEALSAGKSTREEASRLCSEAEVEMIPRLRARGVVLGDS